MLVDGKIQTHQLWSWTVHSFSIEEFKCYVKNKLRRDSNCVCLSFKRALTIKKLDSSAGYLSTFLGLNPFSTVLLVWPAISHLINTENQLCKTMVSSGPMIPSSVFTYLKAQTNRTRRLSTAQSHQNTSTLLPFQFPASGKCEAILDSFVTTTPTMHVRWRLELINSLGLDHSQTLLQKQLVIQCKHSATTLIDKTPEKHSHKKQIY